MIVTVDFPGFKDATVEDAVKCLTKALEQTKKVQANAEKFYAAIAQPVVHRLGKAEVADSNSARSSK